MAGLAIGRPARRRFGRMTPSDQKVALLSLRMVGIESIPSEEYDSGLGSWSRLRLGLEILNKFLPQFRSNRVLRALDSRTAGSGFRA